jgi:hypothetical protein
MEHACDCATTVKLIKWVRLFSKRSAWFPLHAFKVCGTLNKKFYLRPTPGDLAEQRARLLELDYQPT